MRGDRLRQRLPDRVRIARMLEQECALHVVRAVQAGGEAKVAAQKRAGFAEKCRKVNGDVHCHRGAENRMLTTMGQLTAAKYASCP